jgi:hypothetical protein
VKETVMKRLALALALAQAGVLAFAQGAPTHLCGGITQDEAQVLKAQARDHALMLTFAESNGAYLADVDVQIRDSRGAVALSTRCAGPIMLVDLPAGRWRVSATVNGQSREQTVTTARGRTARATFVWPAGAS